MGAFGFMGATYPHCFNHIKKFYHPSRVQLAMVFYDFQPLMAMPAFWEHLAVQPKPYFYSSHFCGIWNTETKPLVD